MEIQILFLQGVIGSFNISQKKTPMFYVLETQTFLITFYCRFEIYIYSTTQRLHIGFYKVYFIHKNTAFNFLGVYIVPDLALFFLV